jgi:hypothetical protein
MISKTIPYLSPPFEADAAGSARWRKVRGLGQSSSGGKEMVVANQRPDDGLGLPRTFVVEKTERKVINPLAWDRECAALALMASMDLRPTNVAKYYGAWYDDTSVYVVSEYCAPLAGGGDLFTASRNGCSGNDRDRARQMLKGLEELHRTGLLHPDPRLENFRLSQDGIVKLSGCVSWGMGNDLSKESNIRQVGKAIYAYIKGDHPPKPYLAEHSATSEDDFFTLMLCEHAEINPSLSSAIDHPWLSPSADVDAGL